MSILVDYNQVVVSNLAVHAREFPEFSENLVRHMILNSLKSYCKKFKREYGPEILVCCDSREQYWRKEIFPFYKANRKKERDNSPIPWKEIFPILNKLKVELKEVFPHKVIEVSGCEADDIIGTLVPRMPKEDKKLIISADQDYLQLKAYVDNLKQWDPIRAKFVNTDDPVAYLKEHIIQGDKGDGIPNCLSQDDTFVAGHRQVTINSKAKEKWLTMLPEDFTDIMQRGFARNKALIDLREIPSVIRTKIIEAYEVPKTGSKQKMMKYCIQNKLQEILAELDAF